jgi:hypothetical protein
MSLDPSVPRMFSLDFVFDGVGSKGGSDTESAGLDSGCGRLDASVFYVGGTLGLFKEDHDSTR